MTFVTTQPEMLAAGAGRLAGIGSELTAQNAAAMATDEVSASTAAQYVSHAARYQAVAVASSGI